MAEEEIKFIDADEHYSENKDMLSFRLIVLQHLQKISRLASTEFRGGYFIVKEGKQSIYVDSTRDAYINAIDYLFDVLYPYFDKEMKEQEKLLFTSFEEEEKDFNKRIVEMEKNKQNPEPLFDKWRIYKTEQKRKLFRQLCCFLKRENYLDVGYLSE